MYLFSVGIYKLPEILQLKTTHTHFSSQSFPGLEAWVYSLGYHKAAIKVSAGLFSSGGSTGRQSASHFFQVAGTINFLVTI